MSNRVTGEIIAIHAELCQANKPHKGFADVSCVGESFEFDVRTAERLAACWNACEGLSDEAVSNGIVRDLLNALQRFIAVHQAGFNPGPNLIEEARCIVAQAIGEPVT
jgi:hypothetical protein